jgi:predicted nucleic acid-binding protein
VILLLDTTVLVDVLRGLKNRRAVLDELLEMAHRLTTSTMCVAEIHAGMRAGEEIQTQRFLNSIPCYPITQTIAIRAGKMKCEWSRKGKTLSLADMLIASTAMEHGLTLMTDNHKDFSMLDVSLHSLP